MPIQIAWQVRSTQNCELVPLRPRRVAKEPFKRAHFRISSISSGLPIGSATRASVCVVACGYYHSYECPGSHQGIRSVADHRRASTDTLRLVLIESTLLCVVGGVTGTFLAMLALSLGGFAIGAEERQLPSDRPSFGDSGSAISICIGVLAGLPPANPSYNKFNRARSSSAIVAK